jgi:hypothetical protein
VSSKGSWKKHKRLSPVGGRCSSGEKSSVSDRLSLADHVPSISCKRLQSGSVMCVHLRRGKRTVTCEMNVMLDYVCGSLFQEIPHMKQVLKRQNQRSVHSVNSAFSFLLSTLNNSRLALFRRRLLSMRITNIKSK